ncbi:3-keto-5-aminohexanoate cleavage protein [Roseomonas frigidaquae]|uniref:3-keto-5-aminohexanoate cleavage protein n=1 Tax=Falsiroseomonas frigidaquae TaxID=487318 RepID=A0ABX1ETB8_9PROT|nr:3-keto-5-aminohexanoate cleavage protein [Falsiroseomonas frigidaquae]NKE43874.1 3-keto-5-aminohexanoate cleavage protein [Falsiroseomonas frigidaquae]
MPTIISCAVTGNITTRANHPELPCTPQEIATACIDAARAGAAIVHIHVRYPDGRPSMELGHYREVVDRIRDSGTDVLINLTTGPGQRFVPSAEDPKVAAPGTTLMHPERRVEHVVALKPDICSLDFNTMYSGTSVVINTPQNLRIMAQLIREAGTKPELECFDSGDIQLAKDLLADGTLPPDPFVQLCLGIKYGAAANAATMSYLASQLPAGARWSAFGVGRWEYPMLAQAWLLGGHVRVGLEDNVYIRKGVLAPSNAALVEKAASLLDALGGEVASVQQAREILGLTRR